MKPASYKARGDCKFLNGDYHKNFGTKNTVTEISGSVKMLGDPYTGARILVMERATFTPIRVVGSNAAGNYKVSGLNSDMRLCILCFPKIEDYNALIFDNVHFE